MSLCIICEPYALETYYKIISKWFKNIPIKNNEELRTYILTPMDALCPSLINQCIVAKVFNNSKCHLERNTRRIIQSYEKNDR